MKPHLDTEVKNQWLAALRGRKYKQGQLQLKSDDNRYCCLGVLCDVVGLPINMKQEQSLLKDKDAAILFNCGKKQAYEIQEKLANMNDGYKDHGDGNLQDVKPQRFYQIARWIERNL